ncbi:glucose-1-phosphate thymidylyltransferase [Desemzia incerta]|uniref:Glucose-1-phosphate thymidylyltransferase n=1 Tax=Desemzia incerta TaxID=82801 RepID=A0A1I5X5A5_9LACT|nr:nucleotidyltransferase family protein [Desemzia incerta]SFQ27153.1 glucose-1-phosphate thymidylyltransferase [Desemzia incerta]
MKAIVLAAGYATRLYPLTKDRPKPLLEVAGKTILDYIVEKMDKVTQIDEVIIVTNDKFTTHFEEWSKSASYTKKLTVVNDGTLTNETRLGAIGDIQFVLEQLKVEDDLMVLAGDNLFDFELTDFASYFDEVGTDCITAYHEENDDQLKRAGIVELDNDGKVLSFEEKPAQPKSSYCVPAFYLYQKDTLSKFKQYLLEGNNPDAPGHFVPFLIKYKPVHAYLFDGKRYDIGNLESYERVQGIFADKTK